MRQMLRKAVKEYLEYHGATKVYSMHLVPNGEFDLILARFEYEEDDWSSLLQYSGKDGKPLIGKDYADTASCDVSELDACLTAGEYDLLKRWEEYDAE